MTRPGRLERVRHTFGSTASPWVLSENCQPVAAPLEVVAAILELPLELVTEAAEHVDPFIHADGTPRWSVHLLGVALSVRRSVHERAQSKQRRYQAATERREVAAARGREAAARNRAEVLRAAE